MRLTMTATLSGGFAVDPECEAPYAAAKHLFSVAPQFYEGTPRDTQRRIQSTAFVVFGTYYYGSHCSMKRMRIEVSLDSGSTFEDLWLGDDVADELGKSSGYQDGYTGQAFRYDGHLVRFVFSKTAGWPDGETIHIRFTGTDGYGRAALKTELVTWGEE
jgi:hypothetical protein